MRSVVVVLPASMCAMMPMLRTLVRSVRTSFCATEVFSFAYLLDVVIAPRLYRRRLSPAVVREGAVRLGHLVCVLTPLDGGTQAIAGVEDLVRQAFDHGLLAASL